MNSHYSIQDGRGELLVSWAIPFAASGERVCSIALEQLVPRAVSVLPTLVGTGQE